jgi:hypothetical protein
VGQRLPEILLLEAEQSVLVVGLGVLRIEAQQVPVDCGGLGQRSRIAGDFILVKMAEVQISSSVMRRLPDRFLEMLLRLIAMMLLGIDDAEKVEERSLVGESSQAPLEFLASLLELALGDELLGVTKE